MGKTKTHVKQDNPAESESSLLDYLSEKGTLPEYLGALVQRQFSDVFGKLDILAATKSLNSEGGKAINGNLATAEKILMIQAISLNTMFSCLAYRASNHDEVELFESLMRLALKAQSQSRATLETLAAVKSPPQVAFVKQANIGHNQQVNNGVRTQEDDRPRAGEIKNQQTQLLEAQNGERLDIGTQSKTINADKGLEALGEVHRAENTRR